MNQAPEFLIRKGPDDFYVKSVSSLEAASFSRPRRVEGAQYELKEVCEQDRVSYVVKSLATERLLNLSERGFELWNLMDGKTSLRALAGALFLKYGIFDFEEIRVLIAQLRENGLIESKIPHLIRVGEHWRRLKNPLLARLAHGLLVWTLLEFKISNVDERMKRLYEGGARLIFTRWFAAGSLALCILAAWYFFKFWADSGWTPGVFLDSGFKWLWAYLILMFQVPIHELAHALAAKHYGYRVRCFGLTFLHGFFPVFYADVTDVWMAPPRQRLRVALAGPCSHGLMGSAALGLAFVLPQTGLLFYMVAFVSYLAMLVNLYPFFFLELDGYYALIDWVRRPHLRRDALGWLRGLVTGRFRRLEPGAGDIVPAVYGGLSLLSILCVLGLAVRGVIRFL